MTIVIERESTEYLYVGVAGDPPSTTQEVAFLPAALRPKSGDWNTATLVDSDTHSLWDTASSVTTGDYFLAVLIGEFGLDGVELPPGDYQIWARLTDDVERPVRIVPEALEVR